MGEGEETATVGMSVSMCEFEFLVSDEAGSTYFQADFPRPIPLVEKGDRFQVQQASLHLRDFRLQALRSRHVGNLPLLPVKILLLDHVPRRYVEIPVLPPPNLYMTLQARPYYVYVGTGRTQDAIEMSRG